MNDDGTERFGLLTSAWLPVRRASGARDVARVAHLSPLADDPVVALDFPRADFDAAVFEMLVGTLALMFAPAGRKAWTKLWLQPPDAATLEAALAPFAYAFALGGPAWAFQDADALADAEPRPVGQLLIDAAGENAAANNSDLFVKRGACPALALPYAAAALVALQGYAPSGGQGHRTSMRGGGPLSTVVRPLSAPDGGPATLWHRLWANVPNVREPVTPDDLPRVLPWLSPTRLSSGKPPIPVTPDDAHPLMTFFACPRRIRLVIGEAGDAACALGGHDRFGPDAPVVRAWRTKNYGASYAGWVHPLSPYREDAAAGLLPLHPGPTSRSYRDWAGMLGALGREAEALRLWRSERRDVAGDAVVDAWGYDMDNMKARAWLHAVLPLHAVADAKHADFLARARQLGEAAREAANALSYAVRLVRAGEFRRDQSGAEKFQLRDSTADELGADAGAAFWAETEAAFVAALYAAAADPDDAAAAQRIGWLATLRRAALDALFPRFAGEAADIGVGLAAKRHARARSGLAAALAEGGRVSDRLGLPRPKREKAA